MPNDFVSNVVYKFSCSGRKSTYVGFTTCHLTKRIHEHYSTDQTPHVFKHINKFKKYKKNLSSNNFEILDKGTTKYQLKQKEAMWIKWHSPDLNKQKQYKLTLSIMV